MAIGDSRDAGIYWQSLMGNNRDGIGGNAHCYRVVTKDAAGLTAEGRFLVDFGLKLGNGRGGYSGEFASPAGLLARRGESLAEGGQPPVAGLLLTHAHEDHIGAVRHLIDMGFDCPPVYATAFTDAMLAKTLVNAGIPRAQWPERHVVKGGDKVRLANAEVEIVPVDHLPGSVALDIRTPEAAVFHTGDYKFDPTLALGERADPERLRALGRQGVDAVLSDSTAASVPGPAVSEREICDSLTRIVADSEGRAVVAGILGSQLDRLVSLGRAAAANGRVLAVSGRSLADNVAAASAAGLDIDKACGSRILTSRESRDLPVDKVLMVTTGAFGQRNAGLVRAADGFVGALQIDADTTVIIPQRAIPAVRHAHGRMVAQLEHRGARVVTAENAVEMGYGPIHQSGHAIERDAKLLYTLLNPRQFVAPMHGDAGQIEANGAVARSLGIPTLDLPRNGAVVRIGQDAAEVVALAEVPRVGVIESPQQAKTAIRGEGRGGARPASVYHYDLLASDGRTVIKSDAYASAGPVRERPEERGADQFVLRARERAR